MKHKIKNGQEVEVSDDGKDWRKRIFIGYKTNGLMVVEGPDGYLNTWKYSRLPQSKPDVIEINVKVNGKHVSLSSISKETLLNIRGEK